MVDWVRMPRINHKVMRGQISSNILILSPPYFMIHDAHHVHMMLMILVGKVLILHSALAHSFNPTPPTRNPT